MKCLPAISAIATFALTACDTMNNPIQGGNFDPLGAPGGRTAGTSATPAAAFKPGQFVKTSMDNTGFYRSRPSGNANADKLLSRGTSMKVIALNGSYAKVELDSGEVGFVPTVMLEDPNAAGQVPPVVRPGEVQVYPPLPGSGVGETLPPADPAGMPPAGAIPTVIDPEAPGHTAPVPAVTPHNETFPAPPADQNVPLPAPANE